MLLIVIDKVLKVSGKDDVAVMTNIAGIVIILITLIGLISDLFTAVRTMLCYRCAMEIIQIVAFALLRYSFT